MDLVCSLCNKTYANKKCLFAHKRNIHNVYCVGKDRRKNETNNKYSCQKCKKNFSFAQSRWLHEKTCKIEIEIEENDPLVLKEENIRLKNEIIELKKMLNCGVK